jgi:lysophospholipase L1-like esterase
MRPFRILIFITAVGVLLLVVALAMPEEGVRITGDLRISFFSVRGLFQRDTLPGQAEVEQLLSASSVTSDPEAEPGSDPLVPPGLFSTPDSLETTEEQPVRPANTDSLMRNVFRLQFPGGREELLVPFFRKLDGLRKGTIRRTRIIHYGDSQIENDRMTGLIRFRLQQHFGGSGTGLVPAIPLYAPPLAFQQDQSGRWERHTFFGKRDTAISHNCYGAMAAFASVPPPGEELPALHFRFNTGRRTGRCDRIRIFMHCFAGDASLIVRLNETVTDTLSGLPEGYSVADLAAGTAVEDLTLYARFPQGGRIYGISFETDHGLQVDNIPMRGSSGLVFSKMDRDQLKAMMEDLSPGLLIMQFGGNVVPYINDPEYYRRAFRRELRFIRGLCPGVPVIVIGPSDMSLKERGQFRTYPAVEPVRNALRSAALESGCAFWDLYEAMGGAGSMPSFVRSDPPLASTDYVHFTPLGANLVAEMCYNALMLEYRNYTTKYRTD